MPDQVGHDKKHNVIPANPPSAEGIQRYCIFAMLQTGEEPGVREKVSYDRAFDWAQAPLVVER